MVRRSQGVAAAASCNRIRQCAALLGPRRRQTAVLDTPSQLLSAAS